MQSHSKARQQIEETEEYEAGASGGLASASVTISTILAAAAAAAMQEKLNIVPVHFLKRGKGQIEQKQMSFAFLIIGCYGDCFLCSFQDTQSCLLSKLLGGWMF